MFPIVVFYFGQAFIATPRGSIMLDCGFSPPMSSLSDRNMRLGDVLLPPGGNNGACTRGCKDCLLYAKFF